jgi:hypothetical protein
LRAAAIGLLIVIALILGALRPVCRPLSEDDLAHFNVPIEQRTDRDMYYLPVFQQRDGQWHHCKTWLSRKLFF